MSTLFPNFELGADDVAKGRSRKRSANVADSEEHRKKAAAEAAKKYVLVVLYITIFFVIFSH